MPMNDPELDVETGGRWYQNRFWKEVLFALGVLGFAAIVVLWSKG